MCFLFVFKIKKAYLSRIRIRLDPVILGRPCRNRIRIFQNRIRGSSKNETRYATLLLSTSQTQQFLEITCNLMYDQFFPFLLSNVGHTPLTLTKILLIPARHGLAIMVESKIFLLFLAGNGLYYNRHTASLKG